MTTLDLFLLQMVAEGIATPYSLREQLHLSPGASIPALRRLQQQGLVSKDKAGPRRRQLFAITSVGTRFLKRGLEELENQVQEAPLDPESICRLLALSGESAKARTAVLDSAISRCIAKLRESKAFLAGSPDLELSLAADAYKMSWVILEIEAWKAQIKGLRQIRSRLGKPRKTP